MVLNTEWAQVEVVDLVNDGSGLGFGIIGGRSTGVVVKTIIRGSLADRDGRLRNGDHILQIGGVNLRGMGSEQVAMILRKTGLHVHMIVARPVEPSTSDIISPRAPIVPTRILGDTEELMHHLERPPLMPSAESVESAALNVLRKASSGELVDGEGRFLDVVLDKGSEGLGVTVAGYICEKEGISGIFVKSITPGSCAARLGLISVNDQIIEVDDVSLVSLTNQEAVEVLRKTGPTVRLKLLRYFNGPKLQELESALADSDHIPFSVSDSSCGQQSASHPVGTGTSSSPLPHPTSVTPMSEIAINGLPQTSTNSDSPQPTTAFPPTNSDSPHPTTAIPPTNSDSPHPTTALPPPSYPRIPPEHVDHRLPLTRDIENATVDYWLDRLGLPDIKIIVAQVTKFDTGGGLGISLEGTVDVKEGREIHPHHYVRSVLPEGPVGSDGRIQSGDELLEVNGVDLTRKSHTQVVDVLKSLPRSVRIICVRQCKDEAVLERPRLLSTLPERIIDSDLSSFSFSSSSHLVKAKSEASIASLSPDTSLSSSRVRAPVEGAPSWGSRVLMVELLKTERGLGFSILDFQDPLNPSETLIVIRSVIHGGVAHNDGRIVPGDRLVSVNEANVCNATLEEAVAAITSAPKGIVKLGVVKPLVDPLPYLPPISDVNSALSSPTDMEQTRTTGYWGPERRVILARSETGGLGISIVGGIKDGRGEGYLSGIFIKNVLPGRTDELRTGDRILEVDGIDLRNATHEKAVEVIRGCGDPVTFLVQSLLVAEEDDEMYRESQENEPSPQPMDLQWHPAPPEPFGS